MRSSHPLHLHVPEAIVVLDAGTSALRAVAVTATGDVSTIGVEPWPVFVPDDAAPFGREYDIDAVGAAIGRLIDAAAAAPIKVRGIAVTGQREGLAFIDRAGRALLLSPNIDARASAEGMVIDARQAEEVYAATGRLPSLLLAPAKLLWLRTHRPGVADTVARCMPLADWMAFALTGEAAMSRTLGVEVGLVDASSGAIAGALLRALEFDPALAPRVFDEGSVVGAVAQGALAGVPVMLAGGDTQCAVAGAGAIDAGGAAVIAGWTAPVQLVTAAPIFDEARRTWTGAHVAPQLWVLESNAGEAGGAWAWVRELMGVSDAEADALAASSPEGADDMLAVLGPGAMRASAMNAGVGALAVPLPFVMSSPNRGDVLRAALEGIACAIRVNVEQIESIANVELRRLALGGGMSRSGVFRRILADVTDRRVEAASDGQTSAVGAAAIAAAGLGMHGTLRDALIAMGGRRTCAEPDAAGAAVCEDVYGRWLELASKMETMQ